MLDRRRPLKAKRGSLLSRGEKRILGRNRSKTFHKLRQAGALIARTGPKHSEWAKTRDAWFIQNPAEVYVCWLQTHPRCPITMKRKQVTLDHVKARSTYPELEFEFSNLLPACTWCNNEKGSTHVTTEEHERRKKGL